jgi:uncharacterized integral membrane protein
MNKLRFDKQAFKQKCLELFLDLLWLIGMVQVTLGVYEILNIGFALITAGGFCLGSAYFKTKQLSKA